MNQLDYLKEFKGVTDKMLSIVTKKNKDYAGTEDAFKNFKMCEALGLCSMEKGILVRMSDKMTRISNLLEKDPDVASESIIDTLIDLAAYSIILILVIKDRKNKK